MAESILSAEKIFPCLLDRLTDDHAEVKKDASPGMRGITLARYREGFLRDLRWLLNAKCHLPSEGLGEYPQVERSVFNFGMPDPSGRSLREMDLAEIEQQIREAIECFEPRILPETLEVNVVAEGDTSRSMPNTVVFEIRGALWASPLPEQFHVKTEINLENGQCVF